MGILTAGTAEAVFAQARDSRYRWGANDCLALICALLRISGREVPDTSLWHGGSYIRAFERATEGGHTIGSRIAAAARDRGIPEAGEPLRCGDVLFAEGEPLRTDGSRWSTRRHGTLDLFVGPSREILTYTVEGLRPADAQFRLSDPEGWEVEESIRCL